MESSEDEAELKRVIEQKRLSLGLPAESRHIGELLRDYTDIRTEEPEDRETQQRYQRWVTFIAGRGRRYENCRLHNFEVTHQAQREAVDKLRAYCLDIKDRIGRGEGLVLFGPKGTGKDHLAVAVCRAAIQVGHTVLWQNGMDMFGDFRDAIDGNREERITVQRLVEPDVLYISDPVPPFGPITNYQAQMLFRVLDGRYNMRKPLIVTMNVADGGELEQRLGAQNADRIKDRVVSVLCDWESYRGAQ